MTTQIRKSSTIGYLVEIDGRNAGRVRRTDAGTWAAILFPDGPPPPLRPPPRERPPTPAAPTASEPAAKPSAKSRSGPPAATPDTLGPADRPGPTLCTPRSTQ